MKKIIAPILTEEYKVVIFIGKRDEICKAGAKYCNRRVDEMKEFFSGRGCTINEIQNGKHPVILIDGDFDASVSLATLAHEASHAVSYIEDALGIEDKSDEFRGHGIASIIRHSLKKMDIKKVIK